MKRRQLLLAAGVGVLLVALFAAGRAVMRAERGTAGVTMRAPDFSAVTLDSPPVSRTMADYRGQVVLLNIWATWCAPCRIEMPSMQALHEEFAPRGLRVVAISIDAPGNEPVIRDFAESYGLTFEILYDPGGLIRRVYQTSGVPETAVIARDGTIRKRVAGAELWNSAANRALIERLLDEGAG